MISLYQSHSAQWGNCQRCLLAETRNKVVLARGSVPCDVLFIGEAPGESENVLGLPFIGPAGKLLDRIIKEAWDQVSPYERCTATWAMTNLVCCIPRNTEEGGKLAEPPSEAIKACSPRLLQFVKICNPRLIVLVGGLATRCFSHQNSNYRTISIVHPAAIIRANVSQRSLAIQKAIVTLSNALEDL